MKNCLLSPFDRVFVEEARANTRDKVAYAKLSVLVMLDEGLTQEFVSKLLGISLGTVNNSKKKYETEGLDRFLDTHYVPYQGRLDDEQLARLEEEVEKGLYSSCSQVIQWIKVHFDVSYSESAVRAILTKLGFVYKKTTSVPGGADPAHQEDYLSEMEPFLEEIDLETEAVFFMDAVHPQHNTRSDYVWAKKGQDKEIRSNTGRNRINLNGAMNAHAPEEVLVIEAETINAQAAQKVLEKIQQKHPNKEVYVFADNARYYTHHGLKKWLEDNPRIHLFHLPPYSPNLNLIERLWKFLRKKVINLHHYPKFDEFRRAIWNFFDNIKQYKNELRTLMKPNFQRFAMCTQTNNAFS